MSRLLLYDIHPENPQERLLKKVVECLDHSGVVILPTDCSYVLAAHPAAAQKLRDIRGLTSTQLLSLLFYSVDSLGDYVKMDNIQYRYLKKLWPGPYTVILKATHSVPKKAITEKRKTIGVRIPNHEVAQSLLRLLSYPLVVTSLIPKDKTEALSEPDEIAEHYRSQVDVFIPGGVGIGHSTVMDWSDSDEPVVIRQGEGAVY